ncbi:phosphatase PAP2 family protein [Alteromonas ponticola]|uniref:undecaprenyl-diphosphate phosphatase n=1 Tax=Alteromonas aquimaris TaxID=2998417 RepID=A0ABT3P6S0_9ALTE|nr:phosphatase PAP2 family protein [Alteromonas aquimaris]MCW8108424.1 phosphatase PAP2 family protein [Alteromonas aquimaris]
MLGTNTLKGITAYKAFRHFVKSDESKKANSMLESRYLSAATKPLSVSAMTTTGLALSKLSANKKIEKFFFRAALSSTIAGMMNAALKRIIGRKRPRADSGPAYNGPTMQDKYNSMPSGHAAAIAAVAGSIPKTSGPLLAASAAGCLATALIGKTRTMRDAHRVSDVLIGSCIGFAASYLVSKIDGPSSDENSVIEHYQNKA